MNRRKGRLASIPYVVWMALFIVAPLILVVIYAFTSRDGGFSLENIVRIVEYSSVLWRSLSLAAIATIICILLGYPVAVALSKQSAAKQRVFLMLLMLPMWINLLLRTYAWMSILENTGLINTFLQNIGFFELLNAVLGRTGDQYIEYIPMINTQGAVVLGMVYNYLPFMIIPIQSVIAKIHPSVIEAAQDLGANSSTVFRRVVFPLSLPGVLSGITMVFVPSVSTFIISGLLGGGSSMMLGDLIQLQFSMNYNPYLGSAISLVMMAIVLICTYVMNRFGEGEEQAVML